MAQQAAHAAQPPLATREFSDAFMMERFKVEPCDRGNNHDWARCPFAHAREKARRRDPATHKYGASPCPESMKGRPCPRGEGCGYTHGVLEYWLHPGRFKTQMCKNGAGCSRPMCFFAHKAEELRFPDDTPADVADPAAAAPTAACGFQPAPLGLAFSAASAAATPVQMMLVGTPAPSRAPSPRPAGPFVVAQPPLPPEGLLRLCNAAPTALSVPQQPVLLAGAPPAFQPVTAADLRAQLRRQQLQLQQLQAQIELQSRVQCELLFRQLQGAQQAAAAGADGLAAPTSPMCVESSAPSATSTASLCISSPPEPFFVADNEPPQLFPASAAPAAGPVGGWPLPLQTAMWPAFGDLPSPFLPF